MKVWLTRHGSTAGNLRKCYVGGGTNQALCAEGIAALQSKAPRRQVQRVYVSGMLRTVQTADILYPQAEQLTLPGLREMEFGRFEGLNWRDLAHDASYRAWVEGDCFAAPPGGESRAEFVARCRDAFTAALHAAMRTNKPVEDAGVHFVIHGGTIMAILSELARPAREYFALRTPPGGTWLCEWDGDALTILEEPRHT